MNKKHLATNMLNGITMLGIVYYIYLLLKTYPELFDDVCNISFNNLFSFNFILVVPTILTIIIYFYATRNQEKFYNLNRISNTLIINNLLIYSLIITDIIYYNKVTSKIWHSVWPSFSMAAVYYIVALSIILLLWIILLKKKKIKK